MTVDYPHDHHANPASADRLRDNFRMLAWVPDPDRLYDRLLALETVTDCAGLFDGVA